MDKKNYENELNFLRKAHQLYFESKNQDAISISSTIASDDMTDLARQINVHTLNSGVTAYLSTDKKRVVLAPELHNGLYHISGIFYKTVGKT